MIENGIWKQKYASLMMLSFGCLFAGCFAVTGFAQSFSMCAGSEVRNKMDNFCPRQEGVIPKHCCPGNVIKQPITKMFLSRLIKRQNRCCFEHCPSADYWREAPADPQFTPQHKLGLTDPYKCVGARRSVPSSIPNTCSVATKCESHSPCPRPNLPVTHQEMEGQEVEVQVSLQNQVNLNQGQGGACG